MYVCGCMREREKGTRRRESGFFDVYVLENTVIVTTPTYSPQWHTLGLTSGRMLSCEILVLLLNFYTRTRIYIYTNINTFKGCHQRTHAPSIRRVAERKNCLAIVKTWTVRHTQAWTVSYQPLHPLALFPTDDKYCLTSWCQSQN